MNNLTSLDHTINTCFLLVAPSHNGFVCMVTYHTLHIVHATNTNGCNHIAIGCPWRVLAQSPNHPHLSTHDWRGWMTHRCGWTVRHHPHNQHRQSDHMSVSMGACWHNHPSICTIDTDVRSQNRCCRCGSTVRIINTSKTDK